MKPHIGRLLLALLASGGGLAWAQPAAIPAPFEATFTVNWRGFNAGTMELQLVRESNGHYRYESRANARGMFRAFFSDEITQTSWLRIQDDAVLPQRYRADDGSEETKRDISLDFAWAERRVTGVAEDKPVELAVPPGAQDVMSMQIAVMRDLMRGSVPASYAIVDKDQVKEYRYIKEDDARIKTAVGELDTVVYRSERAGSKRATRTWYAPSLGFTPVRAERLKEGKREWLMEIRSLQR